MEPRSWEEIKKFWTNLIGNTADTGGSATAGSVMAKLNSIRTLASNASSYASSAKSNTAASTAASKTGTLSQKDNYIISILENDQNGLEALKNAVAGIVGSLDMFEDTSGYKFYKTSIVSPANTDGSTISFTVDGVKKIHTVLLWSTNVTGFNSAAITIDGTTRTIDQAVDLGSNYPKMMMVSNGFNSNGLSNIMLYNDFAQYSSVVHRNIIPLRFKVNDSFRIDLIGRNNSASNSYGSQTVYLALVYS